MLAPRFAVATAAALIALMTTFTVSAGPQSAEEVAAACPHLPDVSWWDTTPQKIVDYVDQTFQGDWDPYIAKWEAYRVRMTQIRNSNGAAVVKSRGLRLEGVTLADHIRDIDQRLAVTRCLKEHFGGKYV